MHGDFDVAAGATLSVRKLTFDDTLQSLVGVDRDVLAEYAEKEGLRRHRSPRHRR